MERSNYLDTLKGLLIFLVCLGHGIQYNGYINKTAFWNDPIFEGIYSFHMPLFMAISGFLAFNFTKKISLSSSIKKLSCLIVPILSWTSLYLIFLLVTNSNSMNLTKIISTYLFGLWYLWALAISYLYLILFTMRRYISLLILTAIILYLKSYYTLYMFIYTFPYFVIGLMCAKYKWHLLVHNNYKTVVLFVIPITLLSMFFWNKETYIYVTKMDFTLYNVKNITLRWIAGLSNSILACIIVYRLKFNKISILSTVGKYSLIIYALSIYAQQNFRPVYETNNSFVAEMQAVIFATGMLLVGLGISKIILKNNTLSYFLAGTVNKR